jgi:hypothetical protein
VTAAALGDLMVLPPWLSQQPIDAGTCGPDLVSGSRYEHEHIMW